MKETVLETLAKFQRQGSNGRFRSVLSLDLHAVKYAPLGDFSDILLPGFLAAKKAIINLKNEDNECLKWAITRALNPIEKNSERIDIKLREKSEVLNWDGLKFPISLSAMNKFKNRNSSISVNIYGYEKLLFPLTISEHNYKLESTVNLLLISDDTKQHYRSIKDIGKLITLQKTTHGHVRHVIFICLNTFNSLISLACHYEYCKSYQSIKVELPEEGSNVYF